MKKMTLGYQKSAFRNVGDDLNPWLLQRVMPDVAFGQADTVLLGIGSILVADRWDAFARKIVLGSGARGIDRLPALDASWDVRFVRGPLSAAALKVPSISDPALLISRYVPRPTTGKGIGIVPYYRSSSRIWRAAAAQIGATVIPPHLDVEPFIEALGRCERVFCEAMHGAIFADALRIPWRPVSFQNVLFEGETHRFKWRDWAGSVEQTFDPLVEPVAPLQSRGGVVGKVRKAIGGLATSRRLAARLRAGLKEDRFVRSADDVFEDRVSRMADAFASVNAAD